MATERIKMFDKSLRSQAKARLAAFDFQFDNKRTFRREIPNDFGTSTHLVEFQIGVRSLAGRFTVNIGVYNARHRIDSSHLPGSSGAPATHHCYPEQWTRLGQIMAPRGMLARFRLNNDPPHDRWWPLHDKLERMERQLRSVLDVLCEDGIEWLLAHDSLEAFQFAESEVANRKRRLRP